MVWEMSSPCFCDERLHQLIFDVAGAGVRRPRYNRRDADATSLWLGSLSRFLVLAGGRRLRRRGHRVRKGGLPASLPVDPSDTELAGPPILARCRDRSRRFRNLM